MKSKFQIERFHEVIPYALNKFDDGVDYTQVGFL